MMGPRYTKYSVPSRYAVGKDLHKLDPIEHRANSLHLIGALAEDIVVVDVN